MISNLVLDALDKELEARGHRFVRYADDFVVLVKSERSAHRVFENLCPFIEQKLGLEINREESAVRPVKELSYPGFSFKGKRIVVSEESMAEFNYRLKELSKRNWSVSMSYRMKGLRNYIRGWMGYFWLSAVYSIWIPIDQWLRRRIRMLLLAWVETPQEAIPEPAKTRSQTQRSRRLRPKLKRLLANLAILGSQSRDD